jgi:hypothetical protein
MSGRVIALLSVLTSRKDKDATICSLREEQCMQTNEPFERDVNHRVLPLWTGINSGCTIQLCPQRIVMVPHYNQNSASTHGMRHDLQSGM